MKIKPKETHYARKKMALLNECCRCKSTIILEKMYVAYNGPYRWKFCTKCVHSIEEAKKASLIKRPTFDPICKK